MKKPVSAALAATHTLTLAACGGSGESAGDSEAGVYPAGGITMTVIYAAGGAIDIAGRAVVKADELGVPVVVQNVEGASGAIGSAEVSRGRAAKGWRSVTTASAVNRVPLIEEVGFPVDDIVPIGVVTRYDGVIPVTKTRNTGRSTT